MIREFFLILSLSIIPIYALDSDMDGVSDKLDKCPNTPFFNQVDAYGCPNSKLILPQDSRDGLYITLGYGFNHNEDLKENEEKQYNSLLSINYYQNNWNYMLILGYFYNQSNQYLKDTIFQLKRTFELRDTLKISLGAGIKLPTYKFDGNKIDYQLQSSFIYYHTTNLSFFGGVGYEFINDRDTQDKVQNIASLYLGSGYFWSNDLYSNISYSYKQSKFQSQHNLNLLQTTLFYKFNEQYFATISYSQEILDDDLHNAFSINIGYTFW
ncbi:hypothetical protein MNB_SV-15-299 [hydrothermal vent metagenome]|uniref:Uncharacterized protein n=1 Tax=hydrothermal vent metagenome TaxID=652676 RepID=A0A1W1EIN7_9ZZZZ